MLCVSEQFAHRLCIKGEPCSPHYTGFVQHSLRTKRVLLLLITALLVVPAVPQVAVGARKQSACLQSAQLKNSHHNGAVLVYACPDLR
jgi:hypothetical protein